MEDIFSRDSWRELVASLPCCCNGGLCADGLQCIEYYGFAGPRGPKFSSCEIPCSGKSNKCPKGHHCTTIADGPGAVCRVTATATNDMLSDSFSAGIVVR